MIGRTPLKQRDPERFAKLVNEWQRIANLHEKTAVKDDGKPFERTSNPLKKIDSNKDGSAFEAKKRIHEFQYNVSRIEKGDNMNLNNNYMVSPRKTLIPELIQANPNRKIKVIDLGTGNGEYMDSLRKSFSREAKFYSTGISKRTAKKSRQDQNLGPLHRNDLKWRSIEELDDRPEFDLIMSSFGELFYGTKPNPETTDIEKENPYKLATRLKKVMSKLNDGGILTIAPIKHRKAFRRLIQKIAELQGFDFEISFRKNYEGKMLNPAYQVIVRKNDNLDFIKKIKRSY
jgi:hypothetical protein